MNDMINKGEVQWNASEWNIWSHTLFWRSPPAHTPSLSLPPPLIYPPRGPTLLAIQILGHLWSKRTRRPTIVHVPSDRPHTFFIYAPTTLRTQSATYHLTTGSGLPDGVTRAYCRKRYHYWQSYVLAPVECQQQEQENVEWRMIINNVIWRFLVFCLWWTFHVILIFDCNCVQFKSFTQIQ